MIDAVTAILIILILIAFLGHCVLDWIELRDEWWEIIAESEEEDGEEEHFYEAYGVSDSMDVIQEKINALRGEK